MATSEVKRGKGYTAPKGRPTVHPTPGGSGRRLSPTVQWLLALVVFLVVLGALLYLGRGFRTAGGGAQGGPPVAAPISMAIDIDLDPGPLGEY